MVDISLFLQLKKYTFIILIYFIIRVQKHVVSKKCKSEFLKNKQIMYLFKHVQTKKKDQLSVLTLNKVVISDTGSS